MALIEGEKPADWRSIPDEAAQTARGRVTPWPQGAGVGELMLAIGAELRRSGNDAFRRELGLSSTAWPIAGILFNCGTLGLNEICQHLGRDKAQISRDISALSEHGLLQAQRNDVDRRRIEVDFSDSALPMVEAFGQLMADRNRQITKRLDAAEQAELRRLLIVLLRNARDMRSEN